MTEFTMPSLGADMEEGLLLEWLVRPGDRVGRGDVVAVVETDKAAIEVECFESGTVGRLLVEPGTRVPVGTPLAVIETGAAAPGPRTGPVPAVRERRAAPTAVTAAPPAAPTPGKPAEPKSVEVPPAGSEPAGPEPVGVAAAEGQPVHAAPAGPVPAEPEPAVGAGPLVRHLAEARGVDLMSLHGTGRGGRITRSDVEHAVSTPAPRVRATPYARRLARELGIDPTVLHGTGDGGAVRAADVRAAVRARAGSALLAPEGPAAPGGKDGELPRARAPVAVPRGSGEGRPTAAMRGAIGDLMSRSKREIPHYYLSTTVDLAAAEDWLHRRNRNRAPSGRLVPAALLLKAAARAAHEVPQLNGFWQDGGFVPGRGVHLGVAVSLREGGLLAPVIHDADTLPPEDLMAVLKDLVRRARLGRLRGSEVSGATLTVTSLGDQGVEAVFGVIHPPQVALAGFGAVVRRPVAVDGLLGVRPVVTATLSADHRATDGAVGARYLTAVDRLLQEPEEL
ncbi:2-oxo acid dehydrogenase subunit E2 [Streptomyces sp. NPDC020801]|uniref:2-oxo acid dehydrogenase subunit E2 n=1 Tax=unclassified Streptomyces TaxID=2593676 RepID=UPI0037964F96